MKIDKNFNLEQALVKKGYIINERDCTGIAYNENLIEFYYHHKHSILFPIEMLIKDLDSKEIFICVAPCSEEDLNMLLNLVLPNSIEQNFFDPYFSIDEALYRLGYYEGENKNTIYGTINIELEHHDELFKKYRKMVIYDSSYELIYKGYAPTCQKDLETLFELLFPTKECIDKIESAFYY